MADIPISRSVTIPDHEVELSFARSGGPGGQHVNTSATKVELRFDVGASQALSEEQKARVRTVLANRISADDVLILTASEHRSQTRNREAVLARFAALVADALRPTRPRRPTRPSRAAKQQRLDLKRRRAEVKQLRRKPPPP